MARDIEIASPLVSVVVPTRNRAALLPRLLTALGRQEYAPYEVIVVDDASIDSTPQVLTEWQGKGRIAIRLDRSAGSYAARNTGWRAARGGIVAFTDDDCIPGPGWLAAHVTALRSNAVGSQGITLPGPGAITPFTHQIAQRHPGAPYRTCNIVYRRSILDQLGGFDASFRWYADNILGLQARKEGEIVFAPNAVVYHPPRRREWRDRAHWRERFEADARHRAELRRLNAETVATPRAALPIVLWVFRPLAKRSLSHLRYLVRHPRQYITEIGPMLREKIELAVAIRTFYRPTRMESATDTRAEPLAPLSERPPVSVVVVTRDRPQLLRETLHALTQQTWQPLEVIVVDNGGGLDLDGVRLVAAPDVGLGAARQAGIDAASGEIVAFTDDDCIPSPAWLQELVAAFRRCFAAWGVQGQTVAVPGGPGSHALRISRPNPLYQTCNMAYRRDALRRVGGFDVDFQGWFEDAALGARILEHGPITFAPRAIVRHQAVPRRPLDRRSWGRLLADERLLARRYPDYYGRIRGSSVTRTVIVRWLIGSPVKTMARGLPSAWRHPGDFLRLLLSLATERRELLRALRRMNRA